MNVYSYSLANYFKHSYLVDKNINVEGRSKANKKCYQTNNNGCWDTSYYIDKNDFELLLYLAAVHTYFQSQ